MSQDTGRPTNYGYKLLSLCKNNNLYIANGRSGLDKGVGKLTCKNTSLIDYMLCSSNVFRKLWIFHAAVVFSYSCSYIKMDNKDNNIAVSEITSMEGNLPNKWK